jgi:hypothetical protein
MLPVCERVCGRERVCVCRAKSDRRGQAGPDGPFRMHIVAIPWSGHLICAPQRAAEIYCLGRTTLCSLALPSKQGVPNGTMDVGPWSRRTAEVQPADGVWFAPWTYGLLRRRMVFSAVVWFAPSPRRLRRSKQRIASDALHPQTALISASIRQCAGEALLLSDPEHVLLVLLRAVVFVRPFRASLDTTVGATGRRLVEPEADSRERAHILTMKSQDGI